MRRNELLEHGDRFGGIVGLGIQIRRLQERLALHLGILVRVSGDALKLTRGRTGVIALGVRHRKLARHIRGQLALGEIAPEILEHADRPIPLLEVDELRCRVVLGGRANLRVRRHARHAQVVIDGPGGIARLLLRLALLVHISCQALGELAFLLGVGSRQIPCLQKCGLRLVVGSGAEL